MPLPITLAAASLLGLVHLFLVIRNAMARSTKPEHGNHDEQSPDKSAILEHRMRVVANFTEYAPLGLILLGLLESSQAPHLLVLGLAIILVLGRILHAWGFSYTSGYSFGRLWGTLLTWFSIAGLSLSGLYVTLIMG
ncbi:MAPEG family protein [Iodidimonas muriae]|nr:MAPEG family protein [Iodidimonas muriae]